MDKKQSSQNYFVPGWLNELLDGHLSPKLPPGRSGTIDHSLFFKDEHLKKNCLNIKNGYRGDVFDLVSNGHSYPQVHELTTDLPEVCAERLETPFKGTTTSGKKCSIQYNKQLDSAFREVRSNSAAVAEKNCSKKDAYSEPQNGKAHNTLDEEFPSLSGERSNEVNGTSAGKRSSVWDNNSREFQSISRSPNTDRDSTDKVSTLQTVVANRINVTKPLVERNVAAPSRTFGGSRKMTILSCGNGRQKNAPVISVNKVVTRELETRKSCYMKLVRRESQELHQMESSIETSAAVTGNERRVLKTWADVVQNSVDFDGDFTNSGSCTPSDGSANDFCDAPIETMEFNDEDERKLLNEMGWDENDKCDELSLEEVNTFLVSCPDFLKKWDLLVDNNSGDSRLVTFTVQKRQPTR